MALLKPFLNVRSHPLRGTKIVYDAESLFCLREIARRRLSGESISDAEIKNMIESEMQLVDGSHSVVCVSEHESELFRSHGAPMVHTLGYALNATPTPDSYKDRSNILFVGALENGSPNADSVLWFIHEVLPRLRGMLPGTVKFLVVGPNETKDISSQDGVEVLGRVPDLSEQYGTARIFVAPTRFAAGIPLKVLEAASFGVPIVGTSMIARQLGWHHESELLVADTAADFATQCTRLYSDTELWQRTRQNALAKIKHEHSPEHFSEKLQMILEHTLTLG